MEAYATVADYEAVYGNYPDDDQLAAWLLKASRIIAAELDAHGIVPDADGLASCSDVCVDMVHRALGASEGLPVGLTQYSMTAGSYSQSGSFPAGYGNLYLTKTERRQLGIAASLAGFYMIQAGRVGGDS